MPTDASCQRSVLVAATLVFWVAWVGVWGVLPSGELSGVEPGPPIEATLWGPEAPSSNVYALAAHPAVVPSATRPATLRGQSQGGGQGSLSEALGKGDTPFLSAHHRAAALRKSEPGRFRSARRATHHLPRPPPVLSEAG